MSRRTTVTGNASGSLKLNTKGYRLTDSLVLWRGEPSTQQEHEREPELEMTKNFLPQFFAGVAGGLSHLNMICLLYTSDAADE